MSDFFTVDRNRQHPSWKKIYSTTEGGGRKKEKDAIGEGMFLFWRGKKNSSTGTQKVTREVRQGEKRGVVYVKTR